MVGLHSEDGKEMNKYRKFVCVLMFFLLILFLGCFKKEFVSIMEYHGVLLDEDRVAVTNMDIDEMIKLIKKANKESGQTTPWDYKYSESFLELEKRSNELLDIGIRLLESDELDFYEKQTIVYAIHLVEFEKLKYFLKDLAISFSNGKVDENIVDHCFFPKSNWSHVVIKNFRDPIIKEAFSICIKSGRISPSLKNYIQLALRGRLWKNVKKHLIDVRLNLGWDKNLDMQDIVPAKYGGIRKINSGVVSTMR